MARRTASSTPVATIDLLAQYDLQEEIGVGDRARVYRARDRVLGQVVAVKLLHDRYGGDAAFAARLYHTARAAASLGHPNIVAVYDHGPHDGSAFITMEYIEGTNLADLLRQGGPLSARRAIPLIARVLDALSAAHAYGIAHGDLHPRNIFVRKDTGDAVVLTDFGMALARERAAQPAGDSADIAAPYRAPEQTPEEPASVAGDIYAAGVILYELLTGQLPAAGGNRRPATITRLLFATIQQAIAADPAQRQPSAAALREALAGGGSVALPAVWVAAPEGPLEAAVRVTDQPVRAPRHRTPYRAAAILVAGALALTGLAGAAALVQSNRTIATATPTIATDTPVEVPASTEEPTQEGSQSIAPTATAATATPAPPLPTATLSTPAAALAPAPSTTPPVPLAQAPTPTLGPRSTPTVATPRVVNSGGAVGVSLENFSPYLLQGAYQPLDVRRRDQPQVALYGVGSGYDTGTLNFEVAALPNGQLTLVLTGLDDERDAHSTIQIVLNGATVYTGPCTFANLPASGSDFTWDQMRLALPQNALRLGPNTLVIRNTSPGPDLSGPYILITNVEFAGEVP